MGEMVAFGGRVGPMLFELGEVVALLDGGGGEV